MTSERTLAQRLHAIANAMATGDLPPYEKEPVPLSRGDLNMLVKALLLLDTIRDAVKQ